MAAGWFEPAYQGARAAARRRAGRPGRIEVTPDGITSADPATAVLSRMRPEQAVPDVRQLCNLGHFFSTPWAAAGWLAAHPDGEVVPVADEFTVVRHAMIQLGWADAHDRH